MEDFYGLEGLQKLSEKNPNMETLAYLHQDDRFVRVSDLDEVTEPIKFGRVYLDEVITIDGVEYVYSADFDDMVADVCDSMEEDEDLNLSEHEIKEQATDIVKQYDWVDIIVVNAEFIPE